MCSFESTMYVYLATKAKSLRMVGPDSAVNGALRLGALKCGTSFYRLFSATVSLLVDMFVCELTVSLGITRTVLNVATGSFFHVRTSFNMHVMCYSVVYLHRLVSKSTRATDQ